MLRFRIALPGSIARLVLNLSTEQSRIGRNLNASVGALNSATERHLLSHCGVLAEVGCLLGLGLQGGKSWGGRSEYFGY